MGKARLNQARCCTKAGPRSRSSPGRARFTGFKGVSPGHLHHGLGKFTRQLLYAPTDVGPAGLSQIMARPDLLRQLPRALQDRFRMRSVRPAGARWLVQRLHDVPISLGRSVVAVAPSGGRVKVRLDNGSERSVDHILLGTGYHVDISKYEFLAPELVQAIQRCNGYPRLKEGLETSVPGLHIIGAPAAWSFGPLMQFVSGTRYASARIDALHCRKSLGSRANSEVAQRTIDLTTSLQASTSVAGFSHQPVGAVVVGGDYQGLGIVRSLGRHKVPVCIIDDEYSISRFSKYATHVVHGGQSAR